jgi:hypothetical protein
LKLPAKNKIVVAVAASLLTTSAALVLNPSVAWAACSNTTAYKPAKVGNNIETGGIGSAGCGDMTIALEWQRVFGWQQKKDVDFVGGTGIAHLAWNCSGTGTHTFRAQLWRNGEIIKTSDTARFSC